MALWNPFAKKKPAPSNEPLVTPTVDQDKSGQTNNASTAPVVPPPVAQNPGTQNPGTQNQILPAANSPSAASPVSDSQGRKPKPASTSPLPTPSASPATSAKKTEKQPEKPEKVGIFGWLKRGLRKTVDVLNTDIRDLIGKEGRLVDDAFLDELFTQLVKTDMGVGPAGKIRDQIHRDFRGRKVMMADLVRSARETIREIMQQDNAEIQMAASGPTVIMVVGVNGSGKTTSIAKLAHRFRSQGKSVVLGAGDTFRAAAVEQLSIWAERAQAQIVTGKPGSDPASVAYRAAETALKSNADVCIVDTAGRLQTQVNLMEELGRIRRVISKVIPEAPHEVLLVLDATAGQNAISQAKGFSQTAGCTGIVLAKLDGSAKGGVVIPIRQEFNLPVKFVGLGESPDALAAFDVNSYVMAMFDEES